MDVKHIGVVIPAYNAEMTITSVIRELIDYGFRRDNIIVINDGSRDKTYEVIKSAGVCVVNHTKNMGKGASLKDGFDAARQKKLQKVITLDADGQHRATEIENFLSCQDDYDMIIGTRIIGGDMPFVRRMVNRTTSLIVSLFSEKYIPDSQSGFRYIDLQIFDRVRLQTNRYQTESEMVFKAARYHYEIGFVPITTLYNNERSYIKPFVDTVRFLRMLAGFLWR
ncbi:MAG: glycosyltransferase family 2 protein [candidate division WOR-3 bacterium]|nr:MAG: glycosyltransferase family 2 protein [candidate division WOR-3 bacterium]